MKWGTAELSEITSIVTKGTTPTTMGRQFTESGINFVKAEALNGDTNLDSQSFAFIDEETHDVLKRSKLEEEDVLVTIAGAQVGRCGFVRPEHIPANTNQAVGVVRVDKRKANPRFVYYFFKLPATFAMCQSLGAAQAAQPNVTLTALRGFKLPNPMRDEQDEIADVLSAYDELMENNRRRMGLLEEAARLLYREWFVRLRFPGHEHTKITHGLPQGWERVPTPEAIEINPMTKLSDEEEHWYVEMADLPTDSMVIQNAIKRDGRNGSKFRNGDTLLARITPCLENGKTGFVNFMADGEAGRGSTEFIVLRSKRVTPEFVYCLARTHDFRGNAIKSMIGSSGRQRVQESCFEKFMVLIPPCSLLDLFNESAEPIFQQIKVLHAQTQKLRAARDLLLPRLMSGEIQV
jgi:type I restriction enzyme S subunit